MQSSEQTASGKCIKNNKLSIIFDHFLYNSLRKFWLYPNNFINNSYYFIKNKELFDEVLMIKNERPQGRYALFVLLITMLIAINFIYRMLIAWTLI